MMKPPPDDSQRLDAAVAAFRAMHVPEPPASDALAARLAAGAGPAAPRHFVLRRRRLLVRITSLAAAAAALLALVALPQITGSSVALADVIKAAARHTLVKY